MASSLVRRVNAPGLALNALFAMLSVVLLFQWRASVQRGEESSSVHSKALKSLENRLQIERGESQSGLAAIRQELDALRRSFVGWLEGLDATGTAALLESNRGALELSESDSVPTERPSANESAAPDGLPPLPDGIRNPISFLKEFSVDRFLKDGRFNSQGKELSGIERSRAKHIALQARTEIARIDNEFELAVAEGLETLRSAGEYVDYARGERYIREPGMLTCAERQPDGMTRMYYLDQHRFSALYDMRVKRAQVATEAVQRLGSLLSK